MIEKSLKEEFQSHFNEPVLMYDKLARVIGYGEDDQDCYLIVQYIGGKIIWNTAVGGYIWLNILKGQEYVKSINGEDWDNYLRLDDYLQLNGAERQEEFLIKEI